MAADRVSVLITFHNQEKYVDKAMQSVLSQKTDFGVKILVGDDYSSDGTCDAVNRWIGQYPGRIELCVPERNEQIHTGSFRASRNRLNLLKHVDTEYFIFLDGDDYFDNEMKLQRQVEILDQKDNLDCIACGHNTYRLYGDGTKTPVTNPNLKEGKLTPKGYWTVIYIHPDALLFRSSFISDINVSVLENNFNDNMITLSAIKHGSIYYIPEYWAMYVQTEKGIWTSGNTVVNNIRNIMHYELSCKICPKLRMQSFNKFCYAWPELYMVRKDIDPDAMKDYYTEAVSKGCRDTSRWIRYRDLNLFQKMYLAVKTFVIRCFTPFSRRLF